MIFIYKLQFYHNVFIGYTHNLNLAKARHNHRLNKGYNSRLYSFCRENKVKRIYNLIVLEILDNTDDIHIKIQLYINDYNQRENVLNQRIKLIA